jgi:hypothetical protein
MEELAPDLFQFRLDAHRVVSLIFRTRNGSDWPRDCREHDLSRQESSISHRISARKNRALLLFSPASVQLSCARDFSVPMSLLFASGCATIGNVHLRFFRRPAVVGRIF